MELLPAIDLRHGAVVRLARGDDRARTVYDRAPLEVLARYAAAGVTRVHVVDLDAAFGEAPQRELLASLARAAAGTVPERAAGGIDIQLGGGLRDREAVEWALRAGFERAVVTSLIARDWELFAGLSREHPGRLIAALDLRFGELRTAGWREAAGLDIDALCSRLRALPLAAVLVTDIERDGMLGGPNLDLACDLGRRCGAPAILSGGVASVADLERAAARPEIGAAVVGRALYDGSIDLAAALAVAERSQVAVAPDGPWSPTMRARSGVAARIIPCLDVAAGRVVKGVRFENLTDQGDPAACALRYAEQGADEIVFLDITAAPERRDTDLHWVRRAAEQVFVPLTVGGGVRGIDDARRLLLAGADKVAVNTAAVERPELLGELAERFGSQCVVVSIDARSRSARQPEGSEDEPRDEWEVVTHGGRTGTGIDAVAWVREAVERGAGEVLLTSIDSDGTTSGYDLELIRRVAGAVAVPVIASGGAGRPEHLADALAAGAAAVLAASIFHHGTYTVAEVKRRLAGRFPMRLDAVVREPGAVS